MESIRIRPEERQIWQQPRPAVFLLGMVALALLLPHHAQSSPTTPSQGPPPAFQVSRDPSVNWRTIQTDRIDVVFPEQLQSVAAEIARIAERAHEFWTRTLGATPSEKTTLVISDRGDLARGSVSVFPHNVIAIDHPGGDASEPFALSWRSRLEQIIFFGYGKIVDQTRTEGLTADLKALFGKVVAPGLLKPWLLREGIASYGATAGPGGENPSIAMMVLRQMARQNEFPTLDQLSAPWETLHWPPPDLASRAIGLPFLRFMESAYDERFAAQLSASYAKPPMAALTGRLGDAADRPLGDLYGEFRKWAVERTDEVMEGRTAEDRLTESFRVSRLGHENWGPIWAPQGDAIVYRHDDPLRGAEMRGVHRDGSGDRLLFGCRCGAPAWLREGTLVYPRLHGGQGRPAIYDLYTYDLNERRERRLTFGERSYLVRPFPDGRRLLLARNHGGLRSSLVIYDVESHSRLVLMEFEEDRRVHSMAISPDGDLIALSLRRQGEGQDIYLLKPGDGDLTRLTHDAATDRDPSFTRDGSSLVFASDRNGVFDLLAVDLEDRRLYRVSRSTTEALSPRISPDGRAIAYVSYGPDGFSIRTLELDAERWESMGRIPSESPAEEGQRDGPADGAERESASYDPAPDLIPTFWGPVVAPNRLGIWTYNRDVLEHHAYELGFSLALGPSEPLYRFDYTNTQLGPQVGFRIEGTPSGHTEAISVSIPLQAPLTATRRLTAGFRSRTEVSELFLRSEISHSAGQGLFRRDSRMAIDAGLEWLGQREERTRRLAVDWRERLQLPIGDPSGRHEIALRASAAWSEREEFRLGGASGAYPLRGYAKGGAKERQVLLASASYGFPIWSDGWACCPGTGSPWPAFLHHLRGATFVDTGIAGPALEFGQLRISTGLEVQLSYVLGYGLAAGSLTAGLAYGFDRGGLRAYFDVGL